MVPRPIQIAISDNRAELGKIGKHDVDAWRIFNGSFVNVSLMPTQLMTKVVEGYAYTACHTRYRDAANFVSGQHLALDYDSGDYRSSFEFILEDAFIRENASFLHSTPSDKDGEPKSRCVFILDKPINSAELYGEASAALVDKFKGMIDKSCKDPARFFYGAKGGKTKWVGNILSFDKLMNDVILPYREKVKREKALLAEQLKNRVVVAMTEVPDEALERHSNSLLARVVNAQDGDKYIALRNVAITFGGYIVTGYYDYDDVVMWLKNAIRQNTGHIDSYEHADKTIESSIAYGMTKPLYFEREPNDTIMPELDFVNPPLSEVQKLQVAQIITVREYEAYHRALVASSVDIGYPEYIIKHLMIGKKEKHINQDTGEIEQGALTVPYYTSTGDVYCLEYRYDDGTFEYTEQAGLYSVKPMFDEGHKYAIVLPDSLLAVDFYLSGDGSSLVCGLPHTQVSTQLPDTQLYCIIDSTVDMENAELLASHGAKFMKVRNINAMMKSLNRSQIENLAIKGKPLKSVI